MLSRLTELTWLNVGAQSMLSCHAVRKCTAVGAACRLSGLDTLCLYGDNRMAVAQLQGRVEERRGCGASKSRVA